MAEMAEWTSNFMKLPDNYQWCPLKWKAASDLGVVSCSVCDGSRCAWWDAERSRCGVLTKA